MVNINLVALGGNGLSSGVVVVIHPVRQVTPSSKVMPLCLLIAGLLACAASAPVFGLELKDYFKTADQRGVELLEQGQHEEAASLFKDGQWRGVSQFRAGKYEEAVEEFNPTDDEASASALFNHGTAAARAGDYNTAVQSLETALNLEPKNKEFEHNLDIARKLKDLAEKNQGDEQQQGEDSEDKQEQDQEKSESEDQSEGDESQESEAESGEPSSSEEQGQDGEPSNEGGELNADAESSDAKSEQPPTLEDFKDPEIEQQEGEPSEEQDEQGESAAAAMESTVSEDDQATQQWLRRIPDDASQLLRNKIRLNHMIEYPDVNHMQEPW